MAAALKTIAREAAGAVTRHLKARRRARDDISLANGTAIRRHPRSRDAHSIPPGEMGARLDPLIGDGNKMPRSSLPPAELAAQVSRAGSRGGAAHRSNGVGVCCCPRVGCAIDS